MFTIKGNYKFKNTLLLLIFIALISSILSPIKANAEEQNTKVVRVGYYENDNFQSGAGDDLVKSGYSYEYLQKLQVFTDWKYEYVYGEYGELYNKLVAGEIDLLTGIAYREDRLNDISYPDIAMGETTYSYLKRSDDATVTASPSSMNGKKIGCLDGVMKTMIEKSIEENNQDTEIVVFDDVEKRNKALINGEVDVILVETGATSPIEGVEELAYAGSSEYYVCVNKGRPDILEDLNLAQSRLLKSDPNVRAQLNEKWFKNNVVSSSLSRRERKWLEEHKSFNVGYYTNFMPYSGLDTNGQVNGIVKDVTQEIFRVLNIGDITINYYPYDSFDDMTEALNEKKIDATFPAYSEFWSAENYDLMPTDSVIDSYYDLIYLGDYPDMDTQTIAIAESNLLIQAYAAVNFPNNQVLFYDSIEGCLDAVANEEADTTLVNSLRSYSLINNKAEYKKLHASQLAGNAPFGFAVSRSSGDLYELLNHGISLMDSSFALKQTYQYDEEYKASLTDLISQNVWATICTLLIIVVVVVLISAILIERKNKYLHREEELNKELAEKLEEISNLNEMLEDNQVKLEESASEQEAQLSEITALNTRLQENQMRLEESVSEQEASLEEISELNINLQENIDILANAGYGIWKIRIIPEGRNTMNVNSELQKILGIEGMNFSDEELYEYYHGRLKDSTDEIEKDDYASMLEGKLRSRTLTWNHPTKGIIYLMAGGTSYVEQNGVQIISGYCGDITDQKHSEDRMNAKLEEAKRAAEAANKAKSAFLFSMSHDIRTPMNAIRGFTELLDRNLDDKEKIKDYVSKIRNSSDFLLSLINDVLEVARIESGKVTLDETVGKATNLSSELEAVFAERMKGKNLEFIINNDIKTEYVWADCVKIKEIFLNLISNAYKYTPEGGRISVSCREVPCDREGYTKIESTVSDNGIGMSEEFLPHVFEEFSRARSVTEGRIEGTGLGMPIVKRLLDIMGGSIEVKSEVLKGTSFIFTITHRIASEADLSLDSYEVDSSLFEGKRILLAEDNELNAEIAIEILKNAGFLVDNAKDGVECVDMLQRAENGYYDLILMDIQMPHMDGYKATQTIRAIRDYEKRSIPIIAMTANAFDEDKRHAYEAGMNGHISKPVDINKLMKMLSEIIQNTNKYKQIK